MPLVWTASFYIRREWVAQKHLRPIFFAPLFGIQLDQLLILWGLSFTSSINTSIITTVLPSLTMVSTAGFRASRSRGSRPPVFSSAQPAP